MKLYTYFRSSAAYRVRIALNMKGLEREDVYVHLRKREQAAPAYTTVNPQGLVPALVDDGVAIGQSLAIVEYLDETHPEPPLLPADAAGRARVRQLALAVACDIHPLNNLKVLQYLGGELGLDEDARNRWYLHWIDQGLGALETMLAGSTATGRYCHGDRPGLADLCLVPQVYNAKRFNADMARYPTVARINDTCLALEVFAKAAPEAQPDAE